MRSDFVTQSVTHTKIKVHLKLWNYCCFPVVTGDPGTITTAFLLTSGHHRFIPSIFKSGLNHICQITQHAVVPLLLPQAGLRGASSASD